MPVTPAPADYGTSVRHVPWSAALIHWYRFLDGRGLGERLSRVASLMQQGLICTMQSR